jgi:hypothetical protein
MKGSKDNDSSGESGKGTKKRNKQYVFLQRIIMSTTQNVTFGVIF